MARTFIKAVTLVVDDDTAYTAEVFKTSPGRYVTEFRKNAGKVLHKESAQHRSDSEAIRTASARLAQTKKYWEGVAARKEATHKKARALMKRGPDESPPTKRRRMTNPEIGPAGSMIDTQEEVNAFVRKMNETTLYATPLGKMRGVKSWERGEVFQAVNPPHWDGSPFFRNSDAERIYTMGYRKIVVGGANGFDVELVMQ